MANIGASNSVLGKLTKKMYEDGLPDEFITAAPYVQKRRKKPLPLGTDMTRGYAASFQEAVGAVSDTDDLPTPSAPVFRNPTFDAVDIASVIQVTDKEIERTKGNTVALAQYLKTVISGASKNFWLDMEWRALHSTDGLRAVVEGAVTSGSSKTVTVEAGQIPLSGIRTNMKIKFINATTNAVVESGVLVTSVNRRAGTFVVETLNNNIPDATEIYADSAQEVDGNINGLGNLIDDSTGAATVLGLSSSLSDWQSLVLGNSGTARVPTLELLDQAYYNSLEEAGEEASEAWMDYIQLRKLVALANRQIVDKREGVTLKVNTHNEVEFIGSAKVHPSHAAINGTIFNIVANDIAIDQTRPLSPLDIDQGGNPVWTRLTGTRKFEAVWIWSGNHTCKSRRIHTRVEDLVAS